LYSSPNVIRVVKPRKLKWVKDVAHMWERRKGGGGGGCAHRILIRKSEEKRPISRHVGRWEDNSETALEGVE
jgi:hypothetical protein